MASPLTFLLPLRYDRVQRVLLVQSGPIDLAIEVARRLRTLFPGCQLEGVVREGDHGAVAAGDFDTLTLVRWEERGRVVRELRRQRYDAVVALASGRGSQALRLLPYLLRTRTILLFNDHLDYFPLHVSRFTTLAHHVSGGGSVGALLRWAAGRILVLPFATLVLLASLARLYARAGWRRTRG